MGRRRRPAAESREEILAVAQAHLERDGPTALRLDAVAQEVGVSRQAVLHHFGSRDGLLRAVVERAWSTLFADLEGLAAAAPDDVAGVIERVDHAVRVKGHGRLGAWLTLSRTGLPDEMFDAVLANLPRRMEAEDSDHRLLLIGAALFGDAVFGARLRMALGLPDTDPSRAAFRAWLADLLTPEP